MTTEPRREAERIVYRVVAQAITTGSNAHVVDDTRLVDALAAAIELLDAEDAQQQAFERGVWRDSEAEDRWQEAYADLREALSALRGDETWHAS